MLFCIYYWHSNTSQKLFFDAFPSSKVTPEVRSWNRTQDAVYGNVIYLSSDTHSQAGHMRQYTGRVLLSAWRWQQGSGPHKLSFNLYISVFWTISVQPFIFPSVAGITQGRIDLLWEEEQVLCSVEMQRGEEWNMAFLQAEELLETCAICTSSSPPLPGCAILTGTWDCFKSGEN